MVAEIEVKSRKDFENKTHKNCFVATQAVDWLMKNRHRAMTNDQGTAWTAPFTHTRHAPSRSPPPLPNPEMVVAALELAEKLRQKGYIKWVGRKTKKISISGTQALIFSVATGSFSRVCRVSGPMSSPQAVAAATSVAGPPFEDDDSYYVFEKKSTNRSSKRGK
jgi:hypothetical protein